MGKSDSLIRDCVHYGIWFDGNNVCIKSDRMNDVDLAERLDGVLLGVHQYMIATNSRWLTHGPSSQGFIGGWAVGLKDSIEKASENGYRWYVGPFDRRMTYQNRLPSSFPKGLIKSLKFFKTTKVFFVDAIT